MTDWTKKNNWFRHRINAVQSDPKLGKLVRLYGAKGYAVYFMSLEYIYEGSLGDLEVEAIAETLKMNKEEVESILESAEEACSNLLFREDGIWKSRKAESLAQKDEDKRADKQRRSKEWREKQSRIHTNIYEDSRTSTSEFALISNEKEEGRVEEYKKEDIKRGESKSIRDKNPLPHTTSTVPLPPSIDLIERLKEKNGRTFRTQSFWDYYNARGWKLDGEPIGDIESLVRRWPEDYASSRDTHEYKDDDVPKVVRRLS